jgi:hypothetical protein
VAGPLHRFTSSRFGGSARVTGYRAPDGSWNQRNPTNGHWYEGFGLPGEGGRSRGRAPTPEDMSSGRAYAVEIDYRGQTYFYTYRTPGGIRGGEIEADFRARLKAKYWG